MDASSRRKGLGRHLMMLLELIARREGMHVLALPVQVRTHNLLFSQKLRVCATNDQP